jgi:hypothetical protein
MRTFALMAALSLGLAAAPALQGEPGNEPDRIARLIRQLGDDEFERREAASRDLEALGDAAQSALQQAAASGDPEVRQRAAALLLVIAERLERSDVKSVPPPRGAVVLFDGKDLDAWVGRAGLAAPAWKLLDGGVMEAQGGDIRTRRTFAESYRLHVEFRVPHMPNAVGQARGNSGVYLHGRYEVQILDSHGLAADIRSCGSIYGLAAPRVNACRRPGVWQSFDIEFHPPRLQGGAGVRELPAPARLTVFQNGVRLHDSVEVPLQGTGGGLEDDPAQPGPILLQDHGCPVQFRNLWLTLAGRR